MIHVIHALDKLAHADHPTAAWSRGLLMSRLDCGEIVIIYPGGLVERLIPPPVSEDRITPGLSPIMHSLN